MRKLRRAPYRSRISGIVHFANGQGEFRALVKPPLSRWPFSSPLVPVFRLALEPVTVQVYGIVAASTARIRRRVHRRTLDNVVHGRHRAWGGRQRRTNPFELELDDLRAADDDAPLG